MKWCTSRKKCSAKAFTLPLLDRRRDDEQGAHGGEDRAGLSRPVVHVLDASRAVGVVGSLISPEQKVGVRRKNASGTGTRRAQRTRQRATRKSFADRRSAQANRTPIEWQRRGYSDAGLHGTRVLDNFRWKRSCHSSIGRRSSTRGNCADVIRRFSTINRRAEGARNCSMMRRDC